jgi:hypothetical protein
MALLAWPSEVGQMLQSGLATSLIPYGFAANDVYYGDRDPTKFPAVTIEVVDMPIDVRFTSRTVRKFAAYLMVYYGRYADAEATRLAADIQAENVCKVLNADPQWKDSGGNQRLIKGWVTRLQPGYAKRNNAILYAARITWEAESQAPL